MNPTTLSPFDLATGLRFSLPGRDATTTFEGADPRSAFAEPPAYSPTLALHRACQQEIRAANQTDTLGTILLGLCAAAALVGGALAAERLASHWSGIEALVRTLIG